jgi:hyaluronan synthase
VTPPPDTGPVRLRRRGPLFVPPVRVPESYDALPERLRRSRLVAIGMRAMQAACVLYAVVLLFWIWMCQDLALSYLATNFPLYTYAILVTSYWLCRFLLAGLYRPTRDAGFRPTAAIVIPAFNEEDCIEATIDACYETTYPLDRLEVVVVDDGSSDGTWARIERAQTRHPSLVAIRFPENRGKRAAMAEGVRRSTSEICVFVDSDSIIEPDGLDHIMADLKDPRVGCVVGSAEILNKYENWITRMQQVRYFVAFRVVKGAESVFGAVTCASGCFSAYRRSAVLPILDEWENQRFLGRPATYGDDRALTNCVLPNWRVTYQSRARVQTIAPNTLAKFLRQQLRWRKSWCRESISVSTFIWRKHPAASALTYVSVVIQWFAPLVLAYMVYWRAAAGDDPSLYLAGAFVMAVLYSLFYAFVRRSPLWWYGMLFVAVYMGLLVWQTYWAAATLRNTSWGTRSAAPGRTSRLRRLASRLAQLKPTVHLGARSRLVDAVLGVAMLPLTFVPIYLYSTRHTDGYLVSDQIEAVVEQPSTVGFDHIGFVAAAVVLAAALIVLRRRLDAEAARGEREAPSQRAEPPRPLMRAAGK